MSRDDSDQSKDVETLSPQDAASGAEVPPSPVGSSRDEPTRVTGAARTRDASRKPPRIRGYRLREELHRGGQGVVYRATQRAPRREVALKVMLEGPLASEVAQRRFEREIDLAASLRHPNIVTILDSGVSHGRYYFAMDYIVGLRLDAHVRAAGADCRATLELFAQICDAINFAHQRGVIHRDLKPSNILVDAEGRPHVLDFGLAKIEQPTDPEQTRLRELSTSGQVIGTLAYMSPEQAAGSQDIDVRSDVYSLGVMLYEAIVGRPPYAVDGPLAEALSRIAREDPARPRTAAASSGAGRVDDELETILLKSLEKEPARRYQTAGDLGRDLRRYLAGEPIEAKRASGLYMLRKALARYRIQAIFAGVVLALLIAFSIASAALYRREAAARFEADQQRLLARQRADQAREAARLAADAEARERKQRQAAELSARAALASADELKRALTRQKMQRGELAQLRGDLVSARASHWDAWHDAPGDPPARWALRRYYADSGEISTTQLGYAQSGPLALSPDARRAALRATERGVVLCDAESGLTLAWRATPGEISVLAVDNEGALAAAGSTWLRAWAPGEIAPAVAIDLDGTRAPRSIHLIAGEAVLLVDDQQIRRFRWPDGALLAYADLPTPPTAPAAFDPATRRLAMPTRAGVEQFDVRSDGRTQWSRVCQAPPNDPVRMTRFLSDGRLVVLTSELLVAEDALSASPAWRRFAVPPGDWLRAAFDPGSQTIALGTTDGDVALSPGRRALTPRKLTSGNLEFLDLADDGRTLVTLDERGALTRWDARRVFAGRQAIQARPAHHWQVAAQGAALTWVDNGARVYVYAPAVAETPIGLHLPASLRFLRGLDADDLGLAISGNGDIVAAHDDSRLWLGRLPQPIVERGVTIERPDAALIKGLALSDDGGLLAALSQSSGGAKQLLSFARVTPRQRGRVRLEADSALPQPIEFVGSLIRHIRFVPRSQELLITRSSGEVMRIPAAQEDGKHVDSEPRSRWLVLDSPAEQIAFAADGRYLVAACDDGVLRLIDVETPRVVAEKNAEAPARSLAIDPAGQSLAVHGADGVLRICSLPDLRLVTEWRWTQVAPGDESLVAWLGTRLVFSDADGVTFLDLAELDAAVEKNRANAWKAGIAQRLALRDYEAARDAALAPPEGAESLEDDALVAVCDAVLRAGRSGWAEERARRLSARTDTPAALRLAHAAYDGGLFALARELFDQAANHETSPLDAQSAWRRAECAYLAGDFDAAAAELDAVLLMRDLDRFSADRAQLERIAALAIAGRRAEARSHLQFVRPVGPEPPPSQPSPAAAIVGTFLLSGRESVLGGEPPLIPQLEQLWVAYKDDMEFFAGELARRRGDAAEARERYQRCVDLAREPWPANWARYRLRQTAP